MRIGVFGGSFDPLHYGHLILAEQCREQAKLDEVWFIPAPRPPHKYDQPPSPFEHRARMLHLVLDSLDGFRVDELEANRAGPSYTADTLDELHQRHPNYSWSLLLGSDSLPDLPQWHEPHRIVARAELIVMERAGFPVMSNDELRHELKLPARARLNLQCVDVPLIELASRDIRRRVMTGQSIRFMVPEVVETYIRENKLYADASTE